MTVTAKMIARELGISESAVSIVFNNKKGVSSETRRRVIDTAHKLGYNFDFRRSVINGKKGNICFVIYKKSGAVVSDTPFFVELSEGISAGCKSEHYDCYFRYLYEDENVFKQIYKLDSSDFAGLILLATEMDENSLKNFGGLRTPILILDAYFEKLAYNYVIINNIQGAFTATEYLMKKRKKQPGYLRSSFPIGNFNQRADGFYKAIRANGMPASKSIVHYLTPSQEGAYDDMKKLLAAGEEPANCYFADNDLIAAGALQAFKELGYRVPEDIAIIGFDDLPLCEYMSPSLSTIEVPKYFMGEISAMRMIQIIENKKTLPVKIEISTKIIIRKST